jgi:hypothetical protein
LDTDLCRVCDPREYAAWHSAPKSITLEDYVKRHALVALLVVLTVGLLVLGIVASGALAQSNGATAWGATLSGFNEVPPKYFATNGTFQATFTNNTLHYQLSYPALGTAAVAAHIHFGQPGVNGGIMAYLCGGGGKPACPPTGGVVQGTITAADVLPVAPQNLKVGDFPAFQSILENGFAYVNVHTTQFPEGALRGQIMPMTASTATPSPMPSASATSSMSVSTVAPVSPVATTAPVGTAPVATVPAPSTTMPLSTATP